MTPLPLLLLTVALLLAAALLTRHRSLAWAVGIGSSAFLILLGAAALQLSLKFPGRDFLAYLERTPPVRTLDSLVTLAGPSLLGLILLGLPLGLLLIRRPLASRAATWVLNIVSAVAGLLLVLWLLFEPFQTLRPELRVTLKLVPVLSDLLKTSWLPYATLTALAIRFMAGHPGRQRVARMPGSWGLWPALALLGAAWLAAGAFRPG